jgi:hypothetical protein
VAELFTCNEPELWVIRAQDIFDAYSDMLRARWMKGGTRESQSSRLD